MRSRDGAMTWQDHRPGAQRNVHSVAWQPRVQGRRTRPAAAAPPSARTGARVGSRRTRGATATTPGRWRSTRTTLSGGTSRRAQAPMPPTGGGSRRLASTGDASASRGARSPLAFPSRCRRCRMPWLPPTVIFSPDSLTGRSGRASIAATAGVRARSEATRSRRCKRSHTRARKSRARGECVDWPAMQGRQSDERRFSRARQQAGATRRSREKQSDAPVRDLDWDWEMPGVTVAGLACAADALVAAREWARSPSPGPVQAGVLALARRGAPLRSPACSWGAGSSRNEHAAIFVRLRHLL